MKTSDDARKGQENDRERCRRVGLQTSNRAARGHAQIAQKCASLGVQCLARWRGDAGLSEGSPEALLQQASELAGEAARLLGFELPEGGDS